MVKKHGMTSEKASRVKQRGHNKEYLFANLIGGRVVKGVNKVDVFGKDGKGYTIKGGSEMKGKSGQDGRWQLFMFSKNRFIQEKNFPGRNIFIEILDSFPDTKKEYDKAPNIYKKKIKAPMLKLKKYLSNKKIMHKFFSKAIFNFKLNYFVIYHDEVFNVFAREELLKIFDKEFEVINNSTMQKVVFRHDKKIVIEIEVRKSEGKFPSMLLITTKMKIFKLLLNNIKEPQKKTRNITVYGTAIDNFSY